MTPLDVGKDDIKALADDVLRELVAHLSTAQLRRDGQPVSGVRAGGRQEAKDGGIDVEVSGGVGGFLPRSVIGFQVKKDDYIPSRVAGEMCPKGELRPSIQALAAQRGAYIIVSGAADISALARQERLGAIGGSWRPQYRHWSGLAEAREQSHGARASIGGKTCGRTGPAL